MKFTWTDYILLCLDASLGGRSCFPEILTAAGAARDPDYAQLVLPLYPEKSSAARA